jgi:hypothetical protein
MVAKRRGPQCLDSAEGFDRVMGRGSFAKLDGQILLVARGVAKAFADGRR